MRKLAVALALLAAAAGTAVAASDRDTLDRYRISWQVKSGNRLTGTSVNFFAPRSWHPIKARDRRHLSFHEGRPICRYTVTFTTRQVADSAETPVEHVTRAVPAAGAPYLLDYGQRGATAAWRGRRLKTPGAPRTHGPPPAPPGAP